MKKILALLSVTLLLAITITGCGSSKVISKVDNKPIYNGTGDTEIGKRGIAYYDPNKITDKDLLEFYDKNIKDSKLNYFTLIDKEDESKGIVFPGCEAILEYGNIDKDGFIVKHTKTRIIEDDKIKDLK